MSQNDAVLSHLRRGVLDPMRALRLYGVFRLAARVHELRQRGHDIRTRRYVTPTTHKRVAMYYLAPK